MFQVHTHPKVQRGRPRKNQTTETTSQNQTPSPDENTGFSDSSDGEIKERKPRGRSAGQTAALARIRAMLETAFGGAILVTSGFNATDAMIISNSSTAIIDSVIALCQQDKKVRDFMYQLSATSAYAGVVIATMPMVIGILANHKLIPPLFMPAPPNAGNVSQNGVVANN